MPGGGKGVGGTKKEAGASKKAVSFAQPPLKKRKRHDDDDDDSMEDNDNVGSETMDDDRYHQVAAARRERRQRMEEKDTDIESTVIDTKTSLQAEGDGDVTIEPFHMNHEETDGTGYFEGDTYVFRKSDPDDGGEADAWLDDIDSVKPVLAKRPSAAQPTTTQSRNLDAWSEEELVHKILPHLSSDTETILQAIRRYSHLTKSASTDRAKTLANDAFLDLTEAASALMLQGKTNIYQQSRQDLARMTQPAVAATTATTAHTVPSQPPSTVLWEYKGQHDGVVHGPYTSQQMLEWTQAGYFVGSSAVPIRKVSSTPAAAKTTAAPTSDDLLSDLMDDDDDDDDAKKPANKETTDNEWQMSDSIDFARNG